MNIMYVADCDYSPNQLLCSWYAKFAPYGRGTWGCITRLSPKNDLMQPGDWVAQTWETYSIVYWRLEAKIPHLLCTRFAYDIHPFCRVVEFCSKLRSELCIREVRSVIPVHVINQRLQMVILPMFPKPFWCPTSTIARYRKHSPMYHNSKFCLIKPGW